MIILEATQIEKALGDRVLFTAERLRINKHDRIGIVGKNGVGKTTLLHILAGTLEPDRGTVSADATIEVIPQLKQDDPEKSGGELTSMYVEKALAANPELLCADEPTMNLDVAKIEQLELALKQYNGAILVISHDRMFLDQVCTKIWEIEHKTITVYKGNYSEYEQQKQLAKRQQQARYEDYVAKKAALERAVSLKKMKAAKTLKPPSRMGTSESKLYKDQKGSIQAGLHKSIKAIETRMEKMEKVEKPTEAAHVKIDLPHDLSYQNQMVIQADRLTGMIGERILWKDVTFQIAFGEKVALIGPNGSGKTTLLKKIINQEQGIRIAAGKKLGYFSQNLDILDPELSIMDNVRKGSIQPDHVIRNVLARLLFRKESVFKKVNVLSGGERVKVAFAKIFLSDMNVLIMDEPTNFLDIDAAVALEQLLVDYGGTVLFVSHDRQFIANVASKIMEIKNQSVVSYDGTYQEYVEREQSKKNAAGRDVVAEELLTVEMKLAEVMGKLSGPGGTGMSPALEDEFQQLIAKRKRLRELLEKKGTSPD